ncbi:MAG TPA: T9SS type A sorting domain-containing protein [Candidatus Kapabacteria bacterium]|nr:T9SS type A sorting domain-containing protein [Candidatus Kapabacteria bacterium]
MIPKLTRSFSILALLLLLTAADMAIAQDSTVTRPDTVGAGGELRPRRGTYIIETYPNPAHFGQSIVVQFYNHNPQELSCDILDLNGRVVYPVQHRTFTPSGLHRLFLQSNRLSSGVYFIRLRTYTPAGKLEEVQSYRFMIAR